MTHSTDYDAGYRDALDDVETRVRYQMLAAPVASMEWRAHMADLAHIEAIRVALTNVTPPGGGVLAHDDEDCGHHPEWFDNAGECHHPRCVTPPEKKETNEAN